MKKVLIIIAIFILILIGWQLYLSYPKQSLKTPSNKIIYIGWIGPITGEMNVLGVDNLNAVKLAVKEYNANKRKNEPTIKLVTANDQYRSAISIQAYNKMITSYKPVAIFVSTYSSVKALAPKALKDRVILVEPVDNDMSLSKLNENIFLIAKETENLAGIVANAIIDRGKRNTVIIYYGDDEFMPTLAMTENEILINNGNQVRLFRYSRGRTDFSPFLQVGRDVKADSYVFFGYQEIGYAMKQARDLGITATFYSVNVITDPILQKNSQGAINGTLFAHYTELDGNLLKTKEFLKNYQTTYQKQPALVWTAMQAYDAANILIFAITLATQEEGNFTDNLRNALLGVTDYNGITGVIRIKSSGASQGIYPSLYILENGKPQRYQHSEKKLNQCSLRPVAVGVKFSG